MEAYSSSSSSTSSMYLAAAATNNATSEDHHHHQLHISKAHRKPFHSSLHSIRNNTNNKPNRKPYVAPLPPNPAPTVYKVDPINFRDLVQSLTGAAAQQGRIQNLAPPKLDLLERPPLQQLLPPTKSGGEEGSPFSGLFREWMMAESGAVKSHGMNMTMMSSSYVEEDSNKNDYFYRNSVTAPDSAITSLELNLLSSSPTSQQCWFPQLLSPAGGT
ncbi:unnamed protein product [Linum trigynum]|uniref:VQ domain-containing protein n=1 Tax=Linum trigynum TaxID=586398 RepID=A0AAV2DFM3_9ROSI